LTVERIGQIEVAQTFAAIDDRHAEDALHDRVRALTTPVLLQFVQRLQSGHRP
jgi:hypothetical protein